MKSGTAVSLLTAVTESHRYPRRRNQVARHPDAPA